MRGRQRGSRTRRVPASAGLAAILAVLALILPDRCTVNEIGHVRAPRGGDLALGQAPRGEQRARFERACPGGPRASEAAEGAASGAILRAPYLQKVTDRGAEVLWTAEHAGTPAVHVGRAGSSVTRVPARRDPSAHLPRGQQVVARLTGLEPATTYCYELRDGTGRVAGPFGFTTAPSPGTDASIRLIALGDMGWRSSDQRAVLAQMQRVEFDLALLAGDIAYPEGTLAELERNFFSVYAPLMHSAPFYPASGNHDYLTAGAGPFRQAFALPENGGPRGRERWYSFDWGDLHVVVLDSEMLVPAQIAWLESDLRRTAAPWIIALLHRAPYSSGEHGPDLPTRQVLAPVLARHRVALVLTGHEHHYERIHPPGGPIYVITGGGGRGTRRISRIAEHSEFAAQVAHFVYMVVERDRLRLWAIDASGRTFDTAALAPTARAAR